MVARHENEISETTDVADRPEFADRKTTKTIDGSKVTGWFTEDFTLAELKTLRARERLPKLRSTEYDGQFDIPTFEEILTLLAEVNRGRDKPIGAITNQAPEHFIAIGHSARGPLPRCSTDSVSRPKAPGYPRFEVRN